MLPVESVYRCSSLKEALHMLKECPEMTVLAAGTDLVPALRAHKIVRAQLLDISRLDGMKDIYMDSSHVLHIGALATHECIAKHPLVHRYLPALAEACARVGSPQIRARATIGGNICHASPAADTAAALAAAGGCAVIVSEDMHRVVALEQFWKGPGKTVLRPGELLGEVIMVVPENGWRGSYKKTGGRSALTIAVASAAVLYDGSQWRVSAGSVNAVVKRLKLIEMYLKKTAVPEKNDIEQLLKISVSPVSDVRATKAYRLKACAGLIWEAWYEMTQAADASDR